MKSEVIENPKRQKYLGGLPYATKFNWLWQDRERILKRNRSQQSWENTGLQLRGEF